MNLSEVTTGGQRWFGTMRSCSFDGSLGRLWLATGCGRGSETNEADPPVDWEACAQARTLANDLDILQILSELWREHRRPCRTKDGATQDTA